MKRALMLALMGASLNFGSLWASPVDFTPRPNEVELDGVRFHDIKFLQGNQEICYRPPARWVASGSVDRACFQSGSGSTLRAEFTHVDGTPAPTWDAEGLKALRERAQAVLPEAHDIKLVGNLRNPLRMNGHDTVVFIFSGVLFSQNYKFFVLLLPLETEQFNFLFYAKENEFEASSKLFLNSLFGFHWKKV